MISPRQIVGAVTIMWKKRQDRVIRHRPPRPWQAVKTVPPPPGSPGKRENPSQSYGTSSAIRCHPVLPAWQSAVAGLARSPLVNANNSVPSRTTTRRLRRHAPRHACRLTPRDLPRDTPRDDATGRVVAFQVIPACHDTST